MKQFMSSVLFGCFKNGNFAVKQPNSKIIVKDFPTPIVPACVLEGQNISDNLVLVT